jgi:alanyl-tRNA synthetase
MKKYGLNELRKMYLDFFESKGHYVRGSYPLVPQNDKSLLLINAGMTPLKPYFTGQEVPPKSRMATCQKCIRTGDIENVGKTARHGTFFEMLGNFSFGDYFKEDAIAYSWEFLTKVLEIDPNRLYVSVYLEDDEAAQIWETKIGLEKSKIVRLGKEDNFWEHGAGPCGPCSEIHYDRGEQYGCGKPTCGVGCDCDRYMEIWNNVFTQFENDGNGNYTLLDRKCIDTGMGLERLATVMQEVDSIFDVDTIKSVRDNVCNLANVVYQKEHNKDISIRLITDHVRSATFMISDGVLPSNEGRGYVLRRLIRRAARHGRLLGIDKHFLAILTKTVIETSCSAYPELKEKEDYILKLISVEEERFSETIDKGLGILKDMIDEIKQSNKNVLAGENAFLLYDTYGFPLDLTKEIIEEDGITVDEDGFNKAMNIQRTTARQARETSNYMGAAVTIYNSIDPSVTSTFVGYENLEYSSKISVLTTESELVSEIIEGDKATIFVEETPFYATSGGQLADLGVIKSSNGEFNIEDTIKLIGGKIGHIGTMLSGCLKLEETVTLVVDKERRTATAKNHSATHLLQKALKNVLGNHIEQAGSYVTSERLRFDFTHFQSLSEEEINKVEAEVNDMIQANLSVDTQIMKIEEAKKTGAMALFGEKYANDVRVVSMGEYSRELCGGTHVANTGVINVFKIITEAGVAAGVRRIEALTSTNALNYYKDEEKLLHEVSRVAKAEPSILIKKVETMLEEIKALQNENEKLKNKLAQGSLGDVMNKVVDVKRVKLLAANIPDVDGNGLRNLGDQLKDKLGDGVVVLMSKQDSDKVNIIVMATDSVVKLGVHAGNLIKEISPIVGGGGGGRPNMAQAGGKNPSKIEEALSAVKVILGEQIK